MARFRERRRDLGDPSFGYGDALEYLNFKSRYFIVGVEWFLAENVKVCSEGRLDDGSVTTGDKGYDVFTIGFRCDFSLHLSHEP